MEFRNLTPFPALCFPIVDADDQDHRCTVLRATYRIEPGPGDTWRLVVQDEEAPPLCFEDRYAGEMNHSSVLEESDLAPWKPACDVIVNGIAHAPQVKPARSWPDCCRRLRGLCETAVGDARSGKATGSL